MRTVFAERPLIAPDDFNVTILSAFSLPLVHFRSPCLGAIHLPPGRSVHLSHYSVFRSSSFLTIFRRTFKERLIDVERITQCYVKLQAYCYVRNNKRLGVCINVFLFGNKKAAHRRPLKTTALEVIYFFIDL